MIGVVVHWEVADPRTNHADCQSQVDGVRAYHLRQGYNDIAYNWLFCQHGGVFTGRGWDRQSAANGAGVPFNATHYAVCWMGGPGHTPTVEAYAACRRLLDEAAAREGATDWIAHSDCVATQCPGDDLRDWVHAGALTGGAELTPDETQKLNEIHAALKGAPAFGVVGVDQRVNEVWAELKGAPAFGQASLFDRLRAVFTAPAVVDVDVLAQAIASRLPALDGELVRAVVRSELDRTRLGT